MKRRTRLLRVLSILVFLPAILQQSLLGDIALLREKGPYSGSMYATPGLSSLTPDTAKITMRSADVNIVLRRGGGTDLAADCEATFVLEDKSAPDSGEKSLLVAFPVTGFESKVATTSTFAVTVNGTTPPTVLQRSIWINRRQARSEITPISGRLDAGFAAVVERGIKLANGRCYPSGYAWMQTSRPGDRTQVRVTYTVLLKAQRVKYSKSYDSAAADSEVIPYADLNIEDWNDRYYFFDYILLSGATWDGPIGREKITVSTAAGLEFKNPVRHLQLHQRRPLGFHPDDIERTQRVYGGYSESWGDRTFEMKDFKPRFDLLMSIPASALRDVPVATPPTAAPTP